MSTLFKKILKGLKQAGGVNTWQNLYLFTNRHCHNTQIKPEMPTQQIRVPINLSEFLKSGKKGKENVPSALPNKNF